MIEGEKGGVPHGWRAGSRVSRNSRGELWNIAPPGQTHSAKPVGEIPRGTKELWVLLALPRRGVFPAYSGFPGAAGELRWSYEGRKKGGNCARTQRGGLGMRSSTKGQERVGEWLWDTFMFRNHEGKDTVA